MPVSPSMRTGGSRPPPRDPRRRRTSSRRATIAGLSPTNSPIDVVVVAMVSASVPELDHTSRLERGRALDAGQIRETPVEARRRARQSENGAGVRRPAPPR